MAQSVPLAAVVPPLHSLVRHAARNRERFTITDQDEQAAVVISADELEDLEDALAVAEDRLRELSGRSRRIPHVEGRRRLGLEVTYELEIGSRRSWNQTWCETVVYRGLMEQLGKDRLKP